MLLGGSYCSYNQRVEPDSTNGLDQVQGIIKPEHVTGGHFKIGRHFDVAQLHQVQTLLKVEIPERFPHIDQVPSVFPNAAHSLVWTVPLDPVVGPPVQVEDDEEADQVEGDLDEPALPVNDDDSDDYIDDDKSLCQGPGLMLNKRR